MQKCGGRTSRLKQVQFLRRILRLLWKSSRWWTVLTAVLFAIETASALGTLYMLKQLLEPDAA